MLRTLTPTKTCEYFSCCCYYCFLLFLLFVFIRSGQLTEICQGLQDYFDVMLGTQLLYKFERPQYSDVISSSSLLLLLLLLFIITQILQSYPDKSPSDIYGIEHFLRLFGTYCRLGNFHCKNNFALMANSEMLIY